MMADTQFQPGQTNPPTQQWWGVFGGDPENIIQDPSMFWLLETTENEIPTEPKTDIPSAENSVDPFGWYVLPQETKEASTEENPQEMAFDINIPSSAENANETIPLENSPIIEETINHEETKENDEKTKEVIIEEEKTIENNLSNIEEKNEEETTQEPVEQIETSNLEEQSEKPVSDIQNKFDNLLQNVEELNSLLSIKNWEVLEIIWANNEKNSILYQFWLNDQKEIYVKRIETDKQNDETNFNELKLWLNPESHLFEIFLDEVLLFEEEDLLQDNKKKSQVMEKVNKLIFLTESKLKDAQKELRAKQEEEEERKRLQDIFRNF